MKNLVVLSFLIFVFGCSSDKGWDCIQTSGAIVTKDVVVPPFTKILVWDRIKLFVEQGEEQQIRIETGENLLNNISVSVVGDKLEIKNKSNCNLFQDYGITKVYVTAPNISEIRSSTGYPVESIGVLRYPALTLLSEDQENEDQYQTDGDFKLNLEVENLNIVANGLSKFYLTGTANYANFGLYAGDSRIFAENLLVENLYIFHRSTGEMIVNPNLAIRGKIVGIGNVIAKNRPAIVEVEELYRGQLIFR